MHFSQERNSIELPLDHTYLSFTQSIKPGFTNRDHLNRWLFAVFLAICWIAHLGSSCIHHGQREQVEQKDQRDKGLLRIGRLWLTALLKLEVPLFETMRLAKTMVV